ncbi:hypothetical protein CVT26_002949 [Gymnopilus dilepis]|uniref:Uncharacterized protein n=1 Tax=Gymnopilus dilepis TaxID=231916 RepID=A0A409Y4N4_9AGAR|nr:hypothetical protein CVT26_002949 [Gymnopilus dilepis]
MQQRNSITECKHCLQNLHLHLRMKLDIAKDDERPQTLENIRRIQAEIKEADQQGIELSKAFKAE